MSADEIENTARVVVGPDEAFDGYSQEDMEASHWACLAGVFDARAPTSKGLC